MGSTRSAGQRRRRVEVAQPRDWKREVTRGGCEMCHAFPVDEHVRRQRALDLRTIQGHHLIEQKRLKSRGLEAHLWDVRNGMGICVYHHTRHGDYIQRIPRELLAPAAHEFAEEVGLTWLLDHLYPE